MAATINEEEVATATEEPDSNTPASTEDVVKTEPEDSSVDVKTGTTDVEMQDVSDAPPKEAPAAGTNESKAKTAVASATKGTSSEANKTEAEAVTTSASSARKKEQTAVVKLSEKERKNLERWYTMPKEPHVLVHPSRTAKSGKFDCSVVSLSVLLDYRPEDTKEHSFEVALFAELFNDMLARDFGYKIYSELHKLAKRANEKAADTKKDGTAAVSGTENAKGGGETSNGEDSKQGATDKNESARGKDDKEQNDRKRRQRSVDDDHRTAKPDTEPARFYTVLPELLLSFVYFDITQCGYMVEKDLVELIYSLGLNLSRSQIRKTVGDVAAAKHTLHYRQLTDKALDTDKPHGKKGGDEAAPAQLPELATDDLTESDLTESQALELARGNTDYMCQLQSSVLQLVNGGGDESTQEPASKKMKTEPTQDLPSTSDGLVEYNGTIVDVGKSLEQTKIIEQARERAERSLEMVRTMNEELTTSNKRSTQHISELLADLKAAKKKLSDNEQTIRDLTRKNTEYHSILTSVYDRVRPAVSIPDRKRSTSTVSISKRESSKEKTSAPKDKEAGTGASQDAKKADKSVGETDKGKREPTAVPQTGERMEETPSQQNVTKDGAATANETERPEGATVVAKSENHE
uniref:LAIKA domain-containing protein n=1 Tax=Anopheles maculatus TaxID=74869 RepID=A0A182S987_9DIPT